jgi:hypothetical protein
MLSLALLVGPAAVRAEWGLIEGEGAQGPSCSIMRVDKTSLIIKLDGRHYVAGNVAIIASNPAWSIKEGDDIGLIGFHNASDRLQGMPVTGEPGFFFYIPIEDMQSWIDSLDESGFDLTRDEKQIGHFPADGLAAAFRKLKACGQRSFAADPFAD